ncbi:MAG: leucine-rich repeat domain-containing protein, partial [Treponema sp.]|nr:leucine-rich repeat domain-containing protein [Treponema sp.]
MNLEILQNGIKVMLSKKFNGNADMVKTAMQDYNKHPDAQNVIYWIGITGALNAELMAREAPRAPEPSSSGDYEYTIEENKIVIKKYNGTQKDVVIPEEIDGKPVAFIGDRAFGGIGFTSVVFPSSLIEIRSYAFSRSEIEEVIIPESVGVLGEDAFARGKLKRVVIKPIHSLIIEKEAFCRSEIEEL